MCIGLELFRRGGANERLDDRYKTLIERWNGIDWQAVASPDVAGASMGLRHVSCVSDTSCFGVGEARTDKDTLLSERWNGTDWSIVPMPTPAGAGAFNYLGDVACASAVSCSVVGWWNENGSPSRAFAEQWNGSSWSLVAVPSVGSASYLTGVSCLPDAMLRRPSAQPPESRQRLPPRRAVLVKRDRYRRHRSAMLRLAAAATVAAFVAAGPVTSMPGAGVCIAATASATPAWA